MSAPAIVALIVAAINTGDTAAFLDLFHEAGMVNDCGSLYHGRQQIKAWSDRELIGAQAHIRVRSRGLYGDTVGMLVDVSGDDFYGCSEFRLRLRAGRILELKIADYFGKQRGGDMKTEEIAPTSLTAAQQSLSDLWDEHVRSEFATKDATAALDTMVDDAYVNHVPVLTGGVGRAQVKEFYANHFIPHMPSDLEIVPVSRTIGADRLVDELILRFTHSVEMDWMLPGVAPTGKPVECATVAIVTFRDGKLLSEHIYWDQASVLVQLGLLDSAVLPIAGADTARKVADHTLPSNQMMERTAAAPRGKEITGSSSVAFKRRPSPETTLDVFGVDVTMLVENEHTAGRFGVLEYVSKPGHEPPPHWHEHEDEVFYVIEGHLEMHVGDQVLHVEEGECVFLPKRKPHGFIIRSPHLRAVCVIQPSGAEQAFRILGLPKNGVERRPAGSSYASDMMDSDHLLKVALQFGVHFLGRDEIAVSMPHFPLPPMP